MTATWFGRLGTTIGFVLAAAWEVWAQGSPVTPGTPATAPVEAPAGGAGGAIVVGVVLALLVGIGILVKLVDARRRREDEMAGLQGRISDALLTDGLLTGLPLTATVQSSMWRSSPATVVLTGTAPSVEVREAARRLVAREMESRGVQFEIEDRVMVDPLMFKQVA